MASHVSCYGALALHQLWWYYIIHVCNVTLTVMCHLYIVTWPTTTCAVDWSQRGHVTFITVEWPVTAEGQGRCSLGVTTNWQSNIADETWLIVILYTARWRRKYKIISNFRIWSYDKTDDRKCVTWHANFNLMSLEYQLCPHVDILTSQHQSCMSYSLSWIICIT